MKFNIQIVFLVLVFLGCKNQKGFKVTESSPVIVIKSVITPTIAKKPLEIVFELKANGTSPVAIAGKDLDVVIQDNSNSWLFTATPYFPNEKRKIFIMQPGQPLILKATVLNDKMNKKKAWYSLPSGEYKIRIYAFSSKTLEFDYQWLGQACSNEYKFMIGKTAVP